MTRVFLQAEWRKLAIANFVVDKKLLERYLPKNTEIDFWNNTCYVSLVGFMFLNTKIKGFTIPFHTNFEEVNLRFYVRHMEKGVWKRGVVFIKEIVPKLALTLVANLVYKENYETMPMNHVHQISEDSLIVEYRWKKERWNSLEIITGTTTTPVSENSEEEFITEHYWGYTKISNEKTSEYGVEHPRWETYLTKEYCINVDFGNLYGKDFQFLTTQAPKSVFLAEGSVIRVLSGQLL